MAEYLDFIEGFIDTNGWAPSVRELAAGLGVQHNAAHRAMVTLEREGFIERGTGPRQLAILV